MKMNQKVVVLGYGFSTRLCLARTLGELGYDISIIVVEQVKTKPIDCYSKYIRNCYYAQGNNEDKIIQILLDKCKDDNQKVILIPINDFCATVLDKNQELLEQYFLFQHIQHHQGAITEWMNKEKQKELAQQIGLNIAKSIDIEIVNKKYEMPSNVHYPCFTKTRAFTPGYKHTLHRCNSENELREVLNDLCQLHENLTLMVEDYKEIEKEYAVVGVSNGKEVIIPAVIEITNMAKGDDYGIALNGTVVPYEKYEELIKKFEMLIQSIGFVGMFDIDFYKSKNLFYFGELNLRIGGSGFAIIKKGVNLPEMHIRSLLGKSLENMKIKLTSSGKYSNERICIDNWFDGYLTNYELLSILKSSEISVVNCKRDIIPVIIFWLKIIKKSLVLCKRKLLRN